MPHSAIEEFPEPFLKGSCPLSACGAVPRIEYSRVQHESKIARSHYDLILSNLPNLSNLGFLIFKVLLVHQLLYYVI